MRFKKTNITIVSIFLAASSFFLYITTTQKRHVLVYDDTAVMLEEQVMSTRDNVTRYLRGANKFHLTKVKITTTNWNVCSKDSGADLDLLVYHIVVPTHFELREQARRTFANRTLFPSVNFVFVLGKSTNLVVNLAVEQESRIYRDIVQADFIDSYSDLTFKSLVAWRWIKHNCRNAKFYMKMDSDVFMNTRRVLDYITNKSLFNVTNLSFAGDIWLSSRPFRDKESKWFVSYDDFPGDVYPPYAHGPFYILTNQLVPLLYNLSFTIKDFWMVRATLHNLMFFFSLKYEMNLIIYKCNYFQRKMFIMECWPVRIKT
jgi:hypothetical protein